MASREHTSADEAGPGEINPTAGSLLGFLELFGPLTGWDLDRAVDGSIGNFWNVTRSQIYRELRDLEGRAMVERGETGARSSTPYAITGPGRGALHTWLAGPPGPDLIRHRLLLTVFFSDLLPRERFEEILETQRVEHRRTLEELCSLQTEVGTQGAMAATLRFGIAYEEMVLDWLSTLPDSPAS